ncbi:hypothetical protein BX070DRAFT_231394 [Coemansia spiralis]|nr:hypothetical protein BX070DRAFT_231394 [Coemansia spiralis]
MSKRKSEHDLDNKTIENTSVSSDKDLEEEEEEDDSVFVVEKILQDRKGEGGQTEYLIKWEGYPNSENTWEKEDNVFDKSMIKEYWEAKKAEAAKTKKSGRANGTNKRVRTSDEHRSEGGPDSDDWEPLVESIDTIDKDNDDGLIVFINWKDGKNTSHPAQLVYKKCPQLMLKFYEERLRFRSKQVDSE